MAESEVLNMSEPILASVLLDLEGGVPLPPVAKPSYHLPASPQRGFTIPNLDKRFARLWRSRQVVGVGSVEQSDSATTIKTSLPLHILATALLSSRAASTAPNIYIIAPHTTQAIPMLHALLAKILANSQVAIELLKPVQLLQYFDLAGLAESVAEVTEKVYRASQELTAVNSAVTNSLTFIQGVGQTISATQRRSGVVQANALLAGLIRNIMQLSRSSKGVSVMVEIPIEIEEGHGWQEQPGTFKPHPSRSMELNSAFSGLNGETLRLACGHETLSRTLEAGLDSVIAVHDGLGRTHNDRRRKESQEQVVEVVKDRSGDLTGLWDVWKEP